MKLTITIDDAQHEALEARAAELKKTVGTLIKDNIGNLLKLDPRENQILLTGKDVDAISQTVGGRTLRTSEDITKLFKDNFRIKVGGVEFDFDPEDAQSLHDQFTGFDTFMTLDEFVRDSVREALSMYLWGSSRGILAYK